MPLQDHFHSPWRKENHWEGFYSAWANTIVRQLNGTLLPWQYRAVPQVHLGAWIEAAVATFERAQEDTSGETATATWAPPQPVQSLIIDLPSDDVFEVQVLDDARGMRLVAVVELVSPGNKDRPESRSAFVTKCGAYLRRQVGVVIVDVVTDRRANFHQEVWELFNNSGEGEQYANLYASSYRLSHANGKHRLETWPTALHVGEPLPTLQLWIGAYVAVPLDVEKSYLEIISVLRLDTRAGG